jgi:hypothetical protein
MADALLEASDPQQSYASRHSAHDKASGDDENDAIDVSQDAFGEMSGLSHQIDRNRATCRYFDNHPRKVQYQLHHDDFFQKHLKSCHFSPCEPLPAPRNEILPDESPLRDEVPFCLMACCLRPVKL